MSGDGLADRGAAVVMIATRPVTGLSQTDHLENPASTPHQWPPFSLAASRSIKLHMITILGEAGRGNRGGITGLPRCPIRVVTYIKQIERILKTGGGSLPPVIFGSPNEPQYRCPATSRSTP